MVTNSKKRLFLLTAAFFLITSSYSQELEEAAIEEAITEATTSAETAIEEPVQAEEILEEAALEEAVIEDAAPVPQKQKTVIIPDSDREEVESFRKLYLSPKYQSLLRSDLEKAMEYRLYVRKALQDREMPFYLEYLPEVESNFRTTAKSKSGALGMWQFMENSVRPFLTLNDFVDERLDPWKSTDAALSKLMDNYNNFGDWNLAIAAYNCGAGAMAKAIRKAGSKDYWYLVEHKFLSTQTCQYVPKLLAIADLAENSDFFEIDLPDHKEEFELLHNEKNGIFDYLTVNKAYSLNQLAQEMRIDSDTLKYLNPSYIRGMTHPAKESKIRLPSGMEQSAKEALTKLTPVDFPFKYTVVSGDSLWSISRRYGVSVQSICDINNIKENDILRIGKILYIPSK